MNMDIVVLLEEGLNQLLNKHNVAFLKKADGVTLESALAAKFEKKQEKTHSEQQLAEKKKQKKKKGKSKGKK